MIQVDSTTLTTHILLVGGTTHDALVQLRRMDARDAYSMEPIRTALVLFDLIHDDVTAPGHHRGAAETTLALTAIRQTLIENGHHLGSHAIHAGVAHIARSLTTRLDMVLLLQPCPGNEILTSLIADLAVIENAATHLEHHHGR